MNLADIVKGVAPTIATALGGPLAGAAVTFLADKLGASDKTQETVAQLVQGVDPVKMKELDNQFQIQMAQMGISLLVEAVIRHENGRVIYANSIIESSVGAIV